MDQIWAWTRLFVITIGLFGSVGFGLYVWYKEDFEQDDRPLYPIQEEQEQYETNEYQYEETPYYG